MEPPPSMAVLKCTSLYTVQRQVFLTKNLLLHGTTDIPVRPEILSVSLLKKDGTDTRREHKLTAGVSLIR